MIVQKAVTPQLSSSYLVRCQDTVAGYVTDAADTADATTPAALYTLLGLGFPDSPHRPDAGYLDVLRFESNELMTFTRPIGGRTAGEAKANNGPFVERPPFDGLGFTAGGHPPVPLWFLDHCRLPPGAELWRLHASRPEELLATYRDIGLGWAGAYGPLPIESRVLPSLMIGPLVRWQDVTWPADLLPTGEAVVLASAGEPPIGGFERSARGYWRREVPLSEVGDFYDLRLTGTWRGARFRIVHRWERDDRIRAELFYIGRNADQAESLGLAKLDAGVYAGAAPISELTDVQRLQITPIALSAHAPR
jgi:hypothetical protein